VNVTEILGTSPLPELAPEGQVAERLVLLVHRGVDWDVWGGPRAARYWDALAERVRAATYAGPTLDHWWQRIARDLASTPRSSDRQDLAVALTSPNQEVVLQTLRDHAQVLVLRIRIAVDASRQAASSGGAQTS
jgi:hypothetical protein